MEQHEVTGHEPATLFLHYILISEPGPAESTKSESGRAARSGGHQDHLLRGRGGCRPEPEELRAVGVASPGGVADARPKRVRQLRSLEPDVRRREGRCRCRGGSGPGTSEGAPVS